MKIATKGYFKWRCMFGSRVARASSLTGIALAIKVSFLLMPLTISQDSLSDQFKKLNDQVGELYQQGKYSEAIPIAKQCLDLATETFGPDALETTTPLNILSYLYQMQGNFEDAESLLVHALKIYEQLSWPDHPDTVTSLNDLAEIYKSQGRYANAEPLLVRALEIREQNLGHEHLETAESLHTLSFLYQMQGKYVEAERLLVRALRFRELQLGKDHQETATLLNNLAGIYQEQAMYEKAEPLLLRVLEIREHQPIPDHQLIEISLNNLAFFYHVQGKYQQAEPLYVRALEICEQQLGPDHPETGLALNNLAYLYRDLGRYKDAESFLRRSLTITEERFGSNHPDTAAPLNNLAGLYELQGKLEFAEPLYRNALNIHEQYFGPDHPKTATSLVNLAGLFLSRGNYDRAEPLYVRALGVRDKVFGPSHPDTTNSLSWLAKLYLLGGKSEKARPFVNQCLLRQHDHQSRMLRYFTDRDCLAMQSKMFTNHLVGNCLNGELAATEQIWFKGAVLEGMNQRHIAEAALTSTEGGAQLLYQRQSLAGAFQKATLETGTNSEGTKTLEEQLSDLEKHIALVLRDKATNLQIGLIGLTEVRGVLDQNDVLVESFRYSHNNVGGIWEPRYSTALIRISGEADYIAHGPAELIEGAIENYRSAVLNKDASLSGEERQSLFAKAETILFKHYLNPIEAKLSAGDTVVFSLDSQLHFIPPGMLRDENGVCFGEKFEVRYVTSGRDLVKEVPKRANDSGSKRALVLGNPTYRDNAPLRALAEVEEEKAALALASNLRAGMTNDAASIILKPLPGTSREVAELESKLKAKGYEVASLTTKGASEEALKQSIEGCDVVHLATHGFFLDEIRIGNERHGLGFDGGTKLKPNTIQDPMYRSGLALSGAQSTFNLWKHGEVPPPSQDGILMAAEAALLDLRGTDLIVLSACETGTGKALDGEGVMGLRRALSMAGATNTVLTLWPVDDLSTVEVMEAFYDKYLNGTPAPKALAEVQRELFGKWTEEFGAAEAVARLGPFICTSVGPVE